MSLKSFTFGLGIIERVLSGAFWRTRYCAAVVERSDPGPTGLGEVLCGCQWVAAILKS